MEQAKKYFSSNDARHLINTYGFALFPVHGIKEDGSCTCGALGCSNPGKHPATPNGLKDATKDIEQLKTLWKGRTGLNVAIATGAASGVFVIDIDSEEGERNLAEICPDLPATLTVKTAKGRHLFFKHPGHDVITKRGALSGVDIRGDGGYVVGPLSHHATGVIYDFVNPLEIIEAAPPEILSLTKKKAVAQLSTPTFARPHLIKTGWTIDDARDHLKYINPDIGYDEWIAVGMALQSEGFGFNLWNEWSAGGAKYDAGNIAAHWRSFKPGAGVSYGTVVHMAQQGGWGRNKVAQTHLQTRQIEPTKPTESIIDPETGEITDSRVLPIVFADDIVANTETNDFVEDLLRDNEFSVLYGESNCGKTFFALDLAMHVALGRKWRDKEVEQRGVIYAALEGGHGTKNRIAAFKDRYAIAGKIPFGIVPSALNFMDRNGDIQALINAIQDNEKRLGRCGLIVVDTLARAISGGDENSSADMGQLIINADALRSVTNAHIMFIHHSGKDALKGARGHSSLRAAVDTEIEVSRPDEHSPSTVKIVKQREMEMIDSMSFQLDRVVLGTNRRGKEVSSCVVAPCEVVEAVKKSKLTPLQQFIFDALADALIENGSPRQIYSGHPNIISVTYDELRDVMESRGFKEIMETEKKSTAEQIKSATQTARLALKNMGRINFNKKYIWVTEAVAND